MSPDSSTPPALAERWDSLDLDTLHRRAGLKWAGGDVRGEHAIGAFIAEMDFGVDPLITAALHEAVERSDFGYLPPRLVDGLREATAGYLAGELGWSVAPEHVHPVPSVITALETAIRHFSAPGSAVIVPTPSYAPFLQVPPTLGREVVQVPLREDGGLDLGAIAAAFADGAGLLVLCNPFNPTGRVFTRAELEAVADVVDRAGGRVFSDEIWAPLAYPGHAHVPYPSVSAAAASHSLTAYSASKGWNLPGLKCAQVVTSNAADLAVWREVAHFIEHGTANLGVIANTVAYTRGGPWREEVLAYLGGNRDLLAEAIPRLLPGVGFTPAAGTYVAWLDLRGLGLEDPVGFFAREAGVTLSDGAACGAAGEGFARLIYAMPRPVLGRAIERMAEALGRRDAAGTA